MGFWEERNEAEAQARRNARHPQDAPAECADCGTTDDTVLLGICSKCFEAHLGARHHAVKDRLDGMGRY